MDKSRFKYKDPQGIRRVFTVIIRRALCDGNYIHVEYG